MGLLDMYLYAGNGEALEIVKKCADWFDHFSGEIPRETMDDMMDLQETGELWSSGRTYTPSQGTRSTWS